MASICASVAVLMLIGTMAAVLLEVVLAAYRSARDGVRVGLPLVF